MAKLRLVVGAMFSGKSTRLLEDVRTAYLRGRKPLVINHSLDTRRGADVVTSHRGDSIPCVQCRDLTTLEELLINTDPPESVSCEVDVSGTTVKYTWNSRDDKCVVLVNCDSTHRTWSFCGDTPVAALAEAACVVDVSRDGLLSRLAAEKQSSPSSSDTYDCVFVDEGQFFGPQLIDFARACVDLHSCDLHVYGLDGDYERNKFGNILDLVPMCDSVEKITSTCGVCKSLPGLFSKRLVASEGQVLVGCSEYVNCCRKCYLAGSI